MLGFKGINGAQAIYNSLVYKNVKDAFIYTGGAIMPLIDCFYKNKINYYTNVHEQCSGHAATAYAKTTGKPGVCVVTSGPGLTNMITPMTDATNDSTPLIVISGNVSRATMGTGAFQECPSVEITKPITKWSYSLKDIHEIPLIMDKAFDIATNGKKGCVHIDVPKCVQTTVFKNDNVKRFKTFSNPIKPELFYNDVYIVTELIAMSKKPVIIVGQGCVDSYKLLRKFAKIHNIPVIPTIHGMGIFDEKDPLSLKFLGMHGNAASNIAIQKADLIINIGSRFDDRTTGNPEMYAPEATLAYNQGRGGIIQVNINGDDINKTIISHYDYRLDSKIFLKTLLNNIPNPHIVRTNWLNYITALKEKYKFSLNKPIDNSINSQMVIKTIGDYVSNKGDFIVTTGVGNHQMWAAQYIDWANPRKFITSGSLGVMGAGLPYAIGSQIANPNSLVIDIDGDGSFNHTLGDLKTVFNYNLPIKIAVMNDGEMSMVKTWEKLFFNGRYTATNLGINPNYVDLAESFGIRGISCSNADKLENTVEEFINYPGPILCDFATNSEQCYPLVKPGAALDDMLLFGDEEGNEKEYNLMELPG